MRCCERCRQLRRALKSKAVRIRLYISTYIEYQQHLEDIHKSVGTMQGTVAYDRICLIRSLRSVGFLNITVLIAEIGNIDLFSSPKKLYSYFGLNSALKLGKKSSLKNF